ncbi:MAG: CpaD family pilus assembly lipoprotein [Alphaproteobacteria bacterium]
MIAMTGKKFSVKRCFCGQNNAQGGDSMKKMFSLKSMVKASLALFSFGLTGCGVDLYEPSIANNAPIQVREEAFLQDVAVADVDGEYIRSLARHYKKHGASAVDLLVTYDPHSKDYTAMKATGVVADIASSLRREYGIQDIHSGIMPVASQNDEPRLLVSYDSLFAQRPEGCDGMMPGLEGRPVEWAKDYKLGCTVETLIARQVAHTSDLLGEGMSSDTTDGRSSANIIEEYRSGIRNQPLEGVNASGN